MIVEPHSRMNAETGTIGLSTDPQGSPIRFGGLTRVDLALICALIAAATVVYLHYALRIGSFQDDEEQYLQIARYISHHFPWALWHNAVPNRETVLFGRGIQRLDLFILAVPFWLLRGPGAFEFGHAIQAALFASTALPVFLMARRARMGRGASLFAATLVLVVPWAVVSTSFLEESAAYPAYAWVLYTTWMAACEPSVRREALVVLALVIAALSRTAMLALAPIFPLTILWQEWRCGLAGKRLPARARALPGRLWARHRVLTVMGALAIAVFVAAELGLTGVPGANKLTGSYGLPHLESLAPLWLRYRDYLARIATGTGFLPLVFAIPWVLGTLVRPREDTRHALAVVCLLGVGCLLLSLLGAGWDERYVLYGAVPVALAAAMALSSTVRAGRIGAVAAVGLAGSALVVVWLINSVAWASPENPYDFFTYPAATFFQRVVLTRISLAHLPVVHSSAEAAVAVAIGIAVAAWILFARSRRLVRPAAGMMAIGLIVVCATQLIYSLHKFTYGSGEGNGPNAAQRSWVDSHVPADASVGIVALSLGETIGFQSIWRVADFWNTSIDTSVYFDTPPADGALPFPLSNKPVGLTIQPTSGLLYVPGETTRTSPPEYLLLSRQDTRRIGLDDTYVGDDPALPLELVKLKKPARADWSLAGTNVEGFMASNQPVTATIYSGPLSGAGRHCASFSLVPPPGFVGRWPYSVRSGGHLNAHGTLLAAQTKAIKVPLYPREQRHGRTATVVVRVHGQITVNGIHLSAALAFFDVTSCGQEKPPSEHHPRR